jgi:hypothetical protein
MAGIGRFKLTDALPQQPQLDESQWTGPERGVPGGKSRRGKAKNKGQQSSEALREAKESAQARNAEASTRDRMVDIGRGNQQAGRQRSSGK